MVKQEEINAHFIEIIQFLKSEYGYTQEFIVDKAKLGKSAISKIKNGESNANLKTIANVTGITKKLTTHVGRHTFATWMLRNGVPIEHVKKMLGHRRVTQTERYAKLLPMDVYGQFDKVILAAKPQGTLGADVAMESQRKKCIKK